MGPYSKTAVFRVDLLEANDPAVNSRMLYQLSYGGSYFYCILWGLTPKLLFSVLTY